MDLLLIPLAYKFVALTVMLAEVNYCAGKLQLPIDLPITRDLLKTEHVSKPFITGFGGTLETDSFSFVFFKSGRLRQIVRLNRFGKQPLRELQLKQSRLTSLINSNGAYQVATNWLGSISVDIAALESKHPSAVEQLFFYAAGSGQSGSADRQRQIVHLPIFQVYWGERKEPVVSVVIYGPTKELLALYQDDESFSRRPKELLKNKEALLAIPDSEFIKYSTEERNTLIERFAAVSYSTVVKSNIPVQYLDERSRKQNQITNSSAVEVSGTMSRE